MFASFERMMNIWQPPSCPNCKQEKEKLLVFAGRVTDDIALSLKQALEHPSIGLD